MEAVSLDLPGLLEYQMNRHPYLMVDAATEVVPGVSARGHKNVTANDWFIPCHFPGDPNMPGMLQLEALVQLSALVVLCLPGHKGRICYLTSVERAKFKRKVVAGDRLDLEGRLQSFKRGVARYEAVGRVGAELACEAAFTLVVPSLMAEFAPVARRDQEAR